MVKLKKELQKELRELRNQIKLLDLREQSARLSNASLYEQSSTMKKKNVSMESDIWAERLLSCPRAAHVHTWIDSQTPAPASTARDRGPHPDQKGHCIDEKT